MNSINMNPIMNKALEQKSYESSRISEDARKEKGFENVSTETFFRKFCEDFPEASFRMYDTNYGGDMDFGMIKQVGANYGEPNHPSITIDIRIMEKAARDKKFAEHLKGVISAEVHDYARYMQQYRDEGKPYGDVVYRQGSGNGMEFERKTVLSPIPFTQPQKGKNQEKNDVEKFKISDIIEKHEKEMTEAIIRMGASKAGDIKDFQSFKSSKK